MSECSFCGKKLSKKKYRVKSELNNKEYSYYLCRKCGSLKQLPEPSQDEIKNYYENYINIKEKMNPGYLNPDSYRNLEIERDKTFQEISFLKQSITGKVNIELGCANGMFLKYLCVNQSGRTIGIDISDDLLKNINLDNVELINGSLKDINSNSCDNLFLFNVLEHIPDTSSFMKDLIRITKEDADIIIEVPLAGFIQKFFGSKWRFLMPDEHLNIPSAKGLNILLDKYNLQIKGLTRFGSGFTTGMTFDFIKKFLDKSAKRYKFGDRAAFLVKKKRSKES